MPLEKSRIKKILVVSLTNIGDVILTLPVIDILKRDFPESSVSISVGPKAASLFDGNPHLKKVYIYDKKQSKRQTIRWMFELRREKFDLVVDLRNSAIPFLIAPRHRTPAESMKGFRGHMMDKHLARLKRVHSFDTLAEKRVGLFISDEQQRAARKITQGVEIKQDYIVIAPGAAYGKKRWPAKNFAALTEKLEHMTHMRTLFVGDAADRQIVAEIANNMSGSCINLAGKTSLVQTAALINEAALVISNDSAVMHLASYLNKPTLAFFGPSDPTKYGPWGTDGLYLRATGKDEDGNDDVASISVDDALNAINFYRERLSFKR